MKIGTTNIVMRAIGAFFLLLLLSCGETNFDNSPSSSLAVDVEPEPQNEEGSGEAEPMVMPEPVVMPEPEAEPVVMPEPVLKPEPELIPKPKPKEPQEPEANIKVFTVGGSDKSIKIDLGSSREVIWEAENASECVVKGSSEISRSLSGSKMIKFDHTETISIECKNQAGEKVSKSIKVVVNIVGDIANKINGYYESEKWGEMVIRIEEGKVEFLGSYNYRKGTVKGTYNPTNGVVTGTWCEEDKGVWGVGEGNKGEAEFIFVENDKNGRIKLEGKWRQGSSGSWKDDWDLFLITDPSQKQVDLKDELDKRFSSQKMFCD